MNAENANLMDASQDAAALAEKLIPPVSTTAVDDERLASVQSHESEDLAWDEIIDSYLIKWGRDLAVLVDEDFTPPTVEIISKAYEVAMYMRGKRWLPPTRAVLDGDGGLAFERYSDDSLQSISFYADGKVELSVFLEGRLKERYSLHFEGQ